MKLFKQKFQPICISFVKKKKNVIFPDLSNSVSESSTVPNLIKISIIGDVALKAIGLTLIRIWKAGGKMNINGVTRRPPTSSMATPKCGIDSHTKRTSSINVVRRQTRRQPNSALFQNRITYEFPEIINKCVKHLS